MASFCSTWKNYHDCGSGHDNLRLAAPEVERKYDLSDALISASITAAKEKIS
jgi:hypothetical protein